MVLPILEAAGVDLVLEVNGPELSVRFLDNLGVWRDYFTLY